MTNRALKASPFAHQVRGMRISMLTLLLLPFVFVAGWFSREWKYGVDQKAAAKVPSLRLEQTVDIILKNTHRQHSGRQLEDMKKSD
jgi:hypothetical protein